MSNYLNLHAQRTSAPPVRHGQPTTSVTQSEPRLQETGIPLANLGVPIPYVVGTKKIGSPNSIWIGNLRPIIRTTEETIVEEEEKFIEGEFDKQHIVTETKITTHSTIGYYMSIQMGLCLGPGVRLRKIGIEDDIIWEGNVGPGRATFNINPGANVESYIQNQVIFQGGNIDQEVDPYLQQHVPNAAETLAAYVGVAYIILRDVRVDQVRGSPWFEVERFPNPLGLSEGVNRSGADINIGTAIADYLSTDWGGGGLGMDAVDTPSFVAAAQRLATENNFCSFVITAEAESEGILNMLSDQAQGAIFEDPAVGKVKFVLFRFDQLNPLTTIKMTEESVTRVQSWSRRSWVGTINKMRIRYIDRDKLYEEASLVAYNFNALNDRIKSNRTAVGDYPTIHSKSVAQAMLGRVLSMTGQPLVSAVLETDRRASGALPGDAVQLFLPERGIPSTIGVVIKVRRFSIDDNRTVLSVTQLPRQDADIVFDAETELGDPIRVQPDPPTAARVMQPPYFLLRRAGVTKDFIDAADLIFPMFLPALANNVQDTFSAWCVNVPGNSTIAPVTALSRYPAVALLSDPIGQFDNIDTGLIPSVTIYGVMNSEVITSEGLTGVRKGQVTIAIGNELFGYESATDNEDGTWTFNNVYRAMFDTAPVAHAADSVVYVFGAGVDRIGTPFTFPLTFSPAWRITSNTAFTEGNPETQFLPTSSFENSSVRRPTRPLRPHNTKINGLDRSETLTNIFEDEIGLIIAPGDSLNITWATRDRTAISLAHQLDPAQPSEFNDEANRQRHRVMIRDSGNTLRDCGVTDADDNYNALTVDVPANTALGLGMLFVRAETDLGNSLYEDQLPVFVFGEGFFVTEEDEDVYFRSEAQTLGGEGIYAVELGGI